MNPLYFRWNDDRAKLRDVDGYFLPGGFSYEDRGRSGMVAGRDSLMDFIGQEAEQGKVVIGNCNGAQILVESGLIPLDHELRMSLARNAIETSDGFAAPGFLSEWVWITPTCTQDRCCTSGWTGPMHLPIAHGEGRFVTTDKDVLAELERNGQIAFRYCNANGIVSMDAEITPNGSQFGAAGICNPAGNVVALMPHPERTENGKPYFDSLRLWIEEKGRNAKASAKKASNDGELTLEKAQSDGIQIFIDMIIVNNEERTVEQTARKFAPGLRLKQWKYVSTKERSPAELLDNLALFNPNKERAYIRRGTSLSQWNAAEKKESPLSEERSKSLFPGITLLRRDLPDTGSASLGKGGQSGVCYVCTDVEPAALRSRKLLEVFFNPHASELHILQ